MNNNTRKTVEEVDELLVEALEEHEHARLLVWFNR